MKKYDIRSHLATAGHIFGSAFLLCSLGAIGPVIAQVTFTPITEGAIVEDTGHFNGCSWGDYDNDGFVDVIVAQRSEGRTAHLYHNNGDGTFSRITEGPIATDPIGATGPAWGDQDNDGDLDLFVSTHGDTVDAFYRNEGDGTFVKVTEGEWVNTPGSRDVAAWADYDGDGYLDLYVVREDGRNSLYHNNGDGTMESVSNTTNDTSGASIGCAWTDYDGDGDLDLFVGGQSKVQFRNEGDGEFTWISSGEGGLAQFSTDTEVGMASADYDNDGDLDLLRGTWDSVGARLYRNDGETGFVSTSGVLPFGGATHPIGLSWGDYDNDGYQDLYISDNSEDNLLYHNDGDGSFTLVTDSPLVDSDFDAGSAAWVDYDNDGDLDLFVANGILSGEEQSCELFRNDGGTNNWIMLDLVGIESNPAAIGAKVWIEAAIDGKAMTQLREIRGSGNGQAQHDTRAHFGLGDAETISNLTIEWPSGAVQMMKDVSANQFLTVTEMNMGGKLANISTRGQVGTGDSVLIAGLVITGATPQTVLIRASGSTLSDYGVTDVLADTVLTVFDSDDNPIATNTNWGDAANATEIAAAITRVGAFALPSDSTDSAILITLDPGAYTAQVSGNGGATGNALVEVYGVD